MQRGARRQLAGGAAAGNAGSLGGSVTEGSVRETVLMVCNELDDSLIKRTPFLTSLRPAPDPPQPHLPQGSDGGLRGLKA
jgi:hypothetical protein